ncbi:MAG: peroxiredoxin-like family protein [Verrucomicrobiota bacterium JB022]|nr:peroxiredoxin-like family protein [Verrucomicrobiota bacterium JB022]
MRSFASLSRLSALACVLGLFTGLQAEKSLKAQLEAQKKAAASQIDQRTKDLTDQAFQQLREQGIVKHALQVGDRAPNFALPNATGQTVQLSELLQDGPVVVTFYRGGWCPYCNLQLAIMQQHLPELKKTGAQLVAISPDAPDGALSTAEKHGLEFQVLSDVNNDAARWFGIVYQMPEDLAERYLAWGVPLTPKRNSPGTYELPLAATYVIDTDGIIKWAFLDVDYTKRAEPADVVAAAKRL